jgi:pyruvate dehydrogenase E1 component alpha subunit
VTTWTVESLRAFEDEVRDIYLQGRIRAPVHLSRGNEEQLMAIFKDIQPGDWCFSTYRSHYHALLKGVPREQVMEQVLAGHSIHLEFPEYRFYSSAIVAGCLPIALGTALGLERRGRIGAVWVFVGDMAAETGAFHEAVQYAQGFNLPITFIVSCNSFSTNSPTHEVWGLRHQHNTVGKTICRERFVGWHDGGVIRYCYDRIFPHYGVGTRVDFDQAEQAPAGERSDVMA